MTHLQQMLVELHQRTCRPWMVPAMNVAYAAVVAVGFYLALR